MKFLFFNDMMSISLHYEIGINIYTKIDIAYPAFPIDFLNFEEIFILFSSSNIKVFLIFGLLRQTESESVFGPQHKSPPLTKLSS